VASALATTSPGSHRERRRPDGWPPPTNRPPRGQPHRRFDAPRRGGAVTKNPGSAAIVEGAS